MPTSCFDEDQGDEELHEIRGLVAYIEQQEATLKQQTDELKELRQQMQEYDLQAIERNLLQPVKLAAITCDIAAQTDLVGRVQDDEDDEDKAARDEALHRAEYLEEELAESQERADVLLRELSASKLELMTCQEKLVALTAQYEARMRNNKKSNGDKPGLERFRKKRQAGGDSNNVVRALGNTSGLDENAQLGDDSSMTPSLENFFFGKMNHGSMMSNSVDVSFSDATNFSNENNKNDVRKVDAAINEPRSWKEIFQLPFKNHHDKEQHAAIILQSQWRMTVARMLFLHARDKARRRQAVVLIQSKWRASYLREHYKLTYCAALTCQPYVRRKQALDRYAIMKKEHYAAITLQVQARGYIQRREWTGIKQLAAQMVTKIDHEGNPVSKTSSLNTWLSPPPLGLSAGNQHPRMVLQATRHLVELTRSACLFPADSTPATRRLELLWKWMERNVGALCIQKTWRRFALQKEWTARRSEAIRIQTVFRMHQKRSLFLNTKSNIQVIQNSFRCYVARQLSAKLLREKIAATRKAAATKIQAMARRYQPRNDYVIALAAIVLIQTRFRMMVAQRECAQRRKERVAATVIQIWYEFVSVRLQDRMTLFTLADRNYKSPLDLLGIWQEDDESVMNEEVGDRYATTESKLDSSTSTGSASDESTDEEPEQVDEELLRRRMVIRAELSCKAHWIQSYWRQRMAIRTRAATVIQGYWRERMSKRSNAAAIIQSYWRERAVFRSCAASVVQKTWRGFVAQILYSRYVSSNVRLKSFMSDPTTKTEAFIQNNIRREVAEYRAVIIIQRWWHVMYSMIQDRISAKDPFKIVFCDPYNSIDPNNLSVDRSASVDLSRDDSTATQRRRWKKKKSKVWKAIRNTASAVLNPSRTHHKNSADRYTPSAVVFVISDDERESETAPAVSRLASRVKVADVIESPKARNPIKMPKMKLSLDTKSKLKKLKSTLALKKRVDLADPKLQRKLHQIDHYNWEDYDFRDQESPPASPVKYSVTPPQPKKHRRKKGDNSSTPSPTSACSLSPILARVADDDEPKDDDVTPIRLGRTTNLSPLRESPAEISDCHSSEESFLIDGDEQTDSKTGDDKENVEQLQATYSKWSNKAEHYEGSGLADLLGKMEAFRVD